MKTRMIYLTLSLLLLFLAPVILPGLGYAQDFTLEDVLRRAEAHSFQLKSSQYQLEAAEANMKAAGAERMPTLSANARAYYNTEVAELSIPIPGMEPRELGSKDNYLFDIKLSAPLFTGGRIKASIDQSEAAHERAEATLAANREDLLLEARVKYFRWFQADELYEAAQAADERTGVIVADILTRLEAGDSDSLELADAKLARVSSHLAELDARTNRNERFIALMMLVGIEPFSAPEPAPTQEHMDMGLALSQRSSDIPEPSLDIVEAMILMQKRTLISAADATHRERQATVRGVASNHLPTLSAYAGFTYGKPNIDMFDNTWNDYFTVGALLSWSFNLGGQTSRQRQSAVALARSAELNIQNISDELTERFLLAKERALLAVWQYESVQSELELAQTNFRLAQTAHQEGALTTNRLLEIQSTLAAAEAKLAAARAGFFIAHSQLLYAAGSPELSEGF